MLSRSSSRVWRLPSRSFTACVAPALVAIISILVIDHLERAAYRRLDEVAARAAAVLGGEVSLNERQDFSWSGLLFGRTDRKVFDPSRWVRSNALSSKTTSSGSGSSGSETEAQSTRGSDSSLGEVRAPQSMQSAQPKAMFQQLAATLLGAGGGSSWSAPQPKTYEKTDLDARADALLSASAAAMIASGTSPPPGVAWPPITLPDECFSGLGYNKTAEAECYWLMDARYRRDVLLQGGDTAPWCWGRSSPPGAHATADPVPPLLAHVLVMDASPHPTLPLLLSSYLATQCCDAALWLWAPPAHVGAVAALVNSTLAGFPAAGRRVAVRPLDLPALWAGLAASVGASPSKLGGVDLAGGAANLSAHGSPKTRSEWGTLLVLGSFGGIAVGPDVVFLRDFRPLWNETRFGYRAGFNIFLSGTVLKLAPASGDPLTARILSAVARSQDPTGLFISSSDAAVGLGRLAQRAVLPLLSEALFDMTWFRHLGDRHEHFSLAGGVHPEIDSHAAWDAFFAPATPSPAPHGGAEDEGALEEGEGEGGRVHQPFMRGSFSYAFHGADAPDTAAAAAGRPNRYAYGLPPGSWAGVLAARFAQRVAEKERVCDQAAPEPHR